MSASYIHTKRKTRVSRLILKFLSILYLLALLATIGYLWFFTQDRFTSVASFKVSRQNGSSSEAGLTQLALPGLSDSGSVDSQVAIGYINSADLLLELENEFKLVEHYGSPVQDFVFRMDRESNLEKRLKYYRKRIFAHFEVASGLTMITVDTFKPELSKKIAEVLLKKAEKFVNITNQQVADQQLDFLRNELERNAQKVEELNKELLTLQNEHNLIKPDEIISATLKAVQEMRMERFKLEAQLSSISRDSPSSPRIANIKSRIISINELVDIEIAKLSGTENDSLNQLLIQFKQLDLKLDFAIRLRTSSELQLEKNRVETIARSRFFNVIQNPYLPEDVAIPRRPYATVTILVLGFMLLLILRALSQSILERG
jgi:capsular polysaccharide transport system permease protein